MGIEVLIQILVLLPNPIRTIQDVERVIVPDVHETLGYVLTLLNWQKKCDEVPLIGFAGSPWQLCATRWKDKDLKVW
jgi:uroporphyrinogen decarboxylase